MSNQFLQEGVKTKTGSKSTQRIKYEQFQLNANRRRSMRSAAFERNRAPAMADMSACDEEEDEFVPPQGENSTAPSTTTAPASSTNSKLKIKDSRMAQLKEWKNKKAQDKKMAETSKKPVFKAGAVHYPLNPTKSLPSPVLPASKKRKQDNSTPMKVAKGRVGATTRNMTKYASKTARPALSAIPTNNTFMPPKGVKPVPLTIPKSPEGMAERKRAVAKAAENFKLQQTLKKPVISVFSQLASMPTRIATPRRNRSILPDNEFATINEEGEDGEIAGTSVAKRLACYVSPFVTVKRGKRSFHQRRSEKLEPPTPVAPDVMPVAVSNSEEEHGVPYFRNILDFEIKRINAMCEKWTEVRATLPDHATEDVIGQIETAICMARLLIRSKFDQFRGIIVNCEENSGIKPITCDDLQGFWDMIYHQVTDVDKSFVSLQELQQNDWKQREVAIAAPKKKAKRAPKPVVTAKPRTGIRAMVLAARQKQLEEGKLEEDLKKSAVLASEDVRVLEINASPVGSLKRRSLIQQVLSANASRRVQRSSPIVMRLSQSFRMQSALETIVEKNVGNTIASSSTPITGILTQQTTLKISNINSTSNDDDPVAVTSSQAQLLLEIESKYQGQGSSGIIQGDQEDKENSGPVEISALDKIILKKQIIFDKDCTPSPRPMARPKRRPTPFRKKSAVLEEDEDEDEMQEFASPCRSLRRSARITPLKKDTHDNDMKATPDRILRSSRLHTPSKNMK